VIEQRPAVLSKGGGRSVGTGGALADVIPAPECMRSRESALVKGLVMIRPSDELRTRFAQREPFSSDPSWKSKPTGRRNRASISGLEDCIVDRSQNIGWQRTFGHGRKIVPELLQRRGADDDAIIAFGA
jgi:hypothetical protein